MILALNPGGNTFYFGPVGENGSAVIKYFADRGVDCPPSKNVAEFILETAAKGGKRADGKRLNWNNEWRSSAENKELLAEIDKINSERSSKPGAQADTQHEFASPIWLQITTLTKRMFRQYWRDPSYLYGKLFVSVVIGIFNGFTFWKLGNSVQDMQNRMFTSFMIIVIPPTIVNGVVPKFYLNRALWEARELPSRIYGWVAFCTANVVTEIPFSIIGGLVYWLLWYYPTGLPRDSATAGYTFLMTILFFLFQTSWGQWICAFAPSFTVISNVSLNPPPLPPSPSKPNSTSKTSNTKTPGPPILLRHLLPLQRRHPPILPTLPRLALLALLPEPVDLLDRRRPGRHLARHPRRLPPRRSRPLRPAPRPDLRPVRRRFRRRRRPPGLSPQPAGHERLRLLSVSRRGRVSAHAEREAGR